MNSDVDAEVESISHCSLEFVLSAQNQRESTERTSGATHSSALKVMNPVFDEAEHTTRQQQHIHLCGEWLAKAALSVTQSIQSVDEQKSFLMFMRLSQLSHNEEKK